MPFENAFTENLSPKEELPERKVYERLCRGENIMVCYNFFLLGCFYISNCSFFKSFSLESCNYQSIKMSACQK